MRNWVWAQRRGRGAWQGHRADAPISDQAPLVWRVPKGPEGLAAVPVGGGRARAGLEIDHSEPSGSRVAISRAGRRPPAHTAAGPHKAARPGRGHKPKLQELGGVTTHGSVGRERNPVIPRASAM